MLVRYRDGVGMGTTPRTGWAASMRRVLAIAGTVFSCTIGTAWADPALSFSETVGTVQLTSLNLLAHSDADGQLRKESARAGDQESSGGFRAEIEAIEESLDISGVGVTPLGLRASRLMLSGLYEFSSGGWRMKPYVGAGFGVLDVNSRLLTGEESALMTDIQFKGGLNFNFTQKLLGRLEWRWSQGSKPTFAFAGVPTKFQLKRGGFVVGFNYKL
jgi:opacity protein-like surface antigen